MLLGPSDLLFSLLELLMSWRKGPSASSRDYLGYRLGEGFDGRLFGKAHGVNAVLGLDIRNLLLYSMVRGLLAHFLLSSEVASHF